MAKRFLGSLLPSGLSTPEKVLFFHAYTKQRKTIYDRSHRKRTLKKLEAAGFKSG
jgi:hypothetical protein